MVCLFVDGKVGKVMDYQDSSLQKISTKCFRRCFMRKVQDKSRMQRRLSIVFVISIMLGFLSMTRADTSVALWQGDKNGAVSITFDDGLSDQVDLAVPLLQERGLKATFFIIGEKLQYEWYSGNIPLLVENGQEIGSHGYAHESLTDMDPNQVEDDLYQSQTALQDLTGQDVATIAYPYGDHDSYVEGLAKEYYIAARSTDYPGVLNPPDPNENELYGLFTTGPYPYYVGNQTVDPNAVDPNVVAYLQDGVDRAASGQGWFIEMLHGINSGWYAISEATLETHLDYLVANEPNIWVAPMGTVSEYIYERDAASITTLFQDSNTIQLELQCGLDPDLFDTPLTLLTPCPPGWEVLGIQVRQGSDIQIADVMSIANSFYIIYDAVPDADTIELSPTQAVHTITASAGTKGSIDPSGEIFPGDNLNQQFTATPDMGYEVDRWIVDSNEAQIGGMDYTLSNITADHTVSVTFKLQTLTVTASAGANGAIDPDGVVSVDYGSGQLFTATPDPGYIVDQWFVDGDAVQDGGMTYDLAIIASEKSVYVAFKPYTTTVALWQRDKKGAASITFNSGFPSQYYNAFPELRDRGLKATFYRTTSQISDPNDILNLVSDGQEIGSQAVTGSYLTTLSEPDVIDELRISQEMLRDLTGQDVATLAYPHGDYDPNVIDLVDDYYIAARSTNPLDDNSPNGLNVSSPILYELVVIETHGNGEGGSNAVAWLQDRVDLAVAEGKWAIEMFHDVNVPGGYDNISTPALCAHFDYLVANDPNVWVAPMGTVSEYIYERDAALITTLVSDGNTISLNLQCGLGNQFNTPLTLLTLCPRGWESSAVFVQQGGTEQIADIVFRDNVLCLMYDAMPNAGSIELVPKDSISGFCLEPDGVTPVEGVLLQADPGPNTLSGADGFYEIRVDYGWSGMIAPEKTGYTFNPDSDEYIDVTQNYINVNYAAELMTYTISGYVLKQGSMPVGGVNLVAENGGGPWTVKYGPDAFVTDADGFYELAVDYDWSGDVTPVDNAYTFDPNKLGYSHVQSPITNQNYVGTMLTFRITGYVRNILGTPVEGCSVVANDGGGTDITDTAGYYEVGVPYGWSGNVEAAKTDYTFTPASAVYTNVTVDQAGDFTAKLDSDIDGSGDVGQPDLLILCQNWLSPGDLSTGDLDSSGTINLRDFAEFANVWLTE